MQKILLSNFTTLVPRNVITQRALNLRLQMMKKGLFSAVLFLTISTVFAQTGITKLDINTGAGNSYPLYMAAFNGKVYGYANDGTKGWEMYSTTGTGTPTLLGDVYPLSGSCISTYFTRPVMGYNGKLYFTADNGLAGYELYVYDGITQPVLAQDIEIGSASSSPDNYVLLNGLIYFRAGTTTHGNELWKYDPATNVPTRLTDINAGSDSSITGDIVAFNNKIYFVADSGSGNSELYVYDPANGNSSMLADLYPSILPSNPMHFTIISNKLYFSADDGNHGRELFMYDGTNPPTRITDLVTGSISSIAGINERYIAPFAGKIYFSGSDNNGNYQLYTIDGSNNTALAASVNSGNNSQPSWLTPYAGKLYFSAYNDTLGFELWSVDSSNNAKLVFEMCKGTGSGNPQQLIAIGDDLYFRAADCMGIGDEMFRFNYKTVTVSKLGFEGEVSIYPNPAVSDATLRLILKKQERLRISLVDAVGREVYNTGEKEYNASTHYISIPTGNIATGIYTYNVYNSKGERYLYGKLEKQ